MTTRNIISATLTTLLVAASALGSAGSASAAGFGPTIPGFDDPVIDTPTFRGACDDKKSPSYGWCLADFTTQFDPISPTRGADGSGFVAVQIKNAGTGTGEALWSTITVDGSKLIDVTAVGGGDAAFDVEQSRFDPNTYFVKIPAGLATGDFAYIGLRFADVDEIDVEVEANFHADLERFSSMTVVDYRLDERQYKNNTDDYRWING